MAMCPARGLARSARSHGAALSLCLLAGAVVAIADPGPPLLPTGRSLMEVINYQAYPHPLSLNATGRVWQVASRDDVVYAASDVGLQVWDYADAEAPLLTGTLLPGRLVYTVRVRGNLAYATDSVGRFHIYDLGTGAALPEELCDAAMLPSLGSTHDIAFNGSLAYVIENSGGIYVIDCANPRSPVLRGHYAVNGGHHDAMAVEGNLGALCQDGDLFMVNLVRPDVPVIGPRITTPGNTNAVILKDRIAYVADQYRGVLILDVHNPSQPVVISRFERRGFYAQRLYLEEKLLVVGNSWGGFVLLDLADLAHPRLVTAYGCGGDPLDLLVIDDRLVTACHFGLHTFGLGNRLGVPRVTVGSSRGDPRDFVTSGQRAFVAGWRGISEFDLSRDGAPALRDSIITGQDLAWGLAVKDQHLYATVDHQGLLVYRLDPHARPTLVGSLPLGARYVFQELAISGNVAVVAAWSWVVFVDISDPTHPVLLSGLGLDQVIAGVDVNGSLAYVAAGYGGVVVIDFSDAAHPTLVNTVATSDRTTGVTWRAPYLHVGSVDGYGIYDATDPRHPVLLSFLDLPVECGQPIIQGRVAYVPTRQQGLQLVSVADPLHPWLIGGYDPLNWQCFAAVANGRVYAAGGDSLYVFPLHRGARQGPPAVSIADPSDGVAEEGSGASLASGKSGPQQEPDRAPVSGDASRPASLAVSAFPNPANPRTQVSLDAPAGGRAVVEVFDLAGRRMQRLLDQVVPAGRTLATWDGLDEHGRPAASGTYLCRCFVDGSVAVVRLLLVR